MFFVSYPCNIKIMIRSDSFSKISEIFYKVYNGSSREGGRTRNFLPTEK